MIFRTITDETIASNSLDVKIVNIETALYHWKSAKYIFSWAEQLELLCIKYQAGDTFDKQLVNLFLDINKDNRRIEQVQFYSENIVLIVADISTFKEENFLKRSIEIDCKKQDRKFTIFEITSKEYSNLNKEGADKVLPDGWVLNEGLTKTFNKYQALFLS